LGMAIPGTAKGIGEGVNSMADSYRMAHRAPSAEWFSKGQASRLDDLTPAVGEDIYGPNGRNYFGTGNDAHDGPSLALIKMKRGQPDANVTVYRAVPADVDAINDGDWVSLSEAYAKSHAKDGWKIIKQRVPVKSVFWDGNDINEFGYDSRPFDGGE
jgi:hypothetical protein